MGDWSGSGSVDRLTYKNLQVAINLHRQWTLKGRCTETGIRASIVLSVHCIHSIVVRASECHRHWQVNLCQCYRWRNSTPSPQRYSTPVRIGDLHVSSITIGSVQSDVPFAVARVGWPVLTCSVKLRYRCYEDRLIGTHHHEMLRGTKRRARNAPTAVELCRLCAYDTHGELDNA